MTKPCYLLQADFSVSSSGDTYCAVPTKEFALAAKQCKKILFIYRHKYVYTPYIKFTAKFRTQIKIRKVVIPCLLSDDSCFAVPKSVIWMCISSLRRIFSGFRSLKGTGRKLLGKQTQHCFKNCIWSTAKRTRNTCTGKNKQKILPVYYPLIV